MVRRVGIDPGTENFAFAVLDDRVLVYATTMRLDGQTQSELALSCVRVMALIVEAFHPDEVWVETQMRERYQAIAWSCLAAAYSFGVSGSLVHALAWKRRVGLAWTGDHDANKRLAVAYARDTLGYAVPGNSNHAADAILIALSPVGPAPV